MKAPIRSIFAATFAEGDRLNTLFQQMLDDPRRTTPSMRNEVVINERKLITLRSKWLDNYCEVNHQDPETVAEYMALALFYRSDRRIPTLSLRHHQIAKHAGTLEAALKWLRRAAREDWTPKQLRAEMRTEMATSVEGREPLHGGIRLSELALLNHWCNVISSHLARDEITPGEVDAMLRELAPAEALATALRRRVAGVDAEPMEIR